MGKRKENYFTRAIRDYGPNFIDEVKSAENLSIEAPRIIRDIVLGKVQYEDHVQYIAHPKMQAALLGYCNRKLQFHGISSELCTNAINRMAAEGFPITIEIQNVVETHKALFYCYSIMVQTFKYVGHTPDPQQLMIMHSKIRDYANYILKY